MARHDAGQTIYNTVEEQLLLVGNHNGTYSIPSSHGTNIMEHNSSTTDDYDYEQNDFGLDEVPLDELVPVAVVYGLTLLLGVIGNSLVIVSVTRYQRMRSITNIFLLSLASADLLLVCICIPVKFAGFATYTWAFGELLCKGVHYLQNVSSVCSVLTLTAMSMERYYAIRHPMRAKYMCTPGRAWRVTCVLWTMSIILALPIIFQKTSHDSLSPMDIKRQSTPLPSHHSLGPDLLKAPAWTA
ncbi:G-protein coupled receptor 54 [Biomphalaria glabrata]|nr:G-protein coupled receptor 54 [Biomphalaria glabrata]